MVFKTLYCLLIFAFCDGYVITSPRKWSSGDQSQVCVSFTGPKVDNDHLYITLKAKRGDVVYIDKKQIQFPDSAQRTICTKISTPVINVGDATLSIEGALEGKKVTEHRDIAIVRPKDSFKTYVQTDKFLYKPSQLVNIRILSLEGPRWNIFNGEYPEIWIENPSKSRLKQWLNVSTKGLLHLSYRLSEEPPQGTYKIRVRSPYNDTLDAHFKVEDYVLPRFSVTSKAPSYLLPTTTSFSYEVCARYTFGQPVKGTVEFRLFNDEYGRNRKEIQRVENITGCVTLPFENYGDLLSSQRAFHITFDAEVTEEGTETVLKADRTRTPIELEAINFEDVSLQKFAKPGLPFLAEVRGTFPDGAPAQSEPVEICVKGICKNDFTSMDGNVKFALPPHLIKEEFKISAQNYTQEAEGEGSGRMKRSVFTKTLEEYHSPSKSSLSLNIDQDLRCTSNQNMEVNLVVWFSTPTPITTTVTAQVLSRGQIIFSDSRIQTLSSGSLPIVDELYLETPKRSPDDPLSGHFTFPIALNRIVSSNIKILVWYVREDGEVVSDSRSLKVDAHKCLPNDVEFKWASASGYPGDDTSMSLKSAPNSLCSLGVVDKSVTLLQPDTDDISAERLINDAKTFSISPNEKKQTDDDKYCRAKHTTTTTTTTTTTWPSINGRPRPGPPPRFGWWPEPDFYYDYKAEGKDAILMFNDAGVHVISDHQTEFRACKSEKRHHYWHHRRVPQFAVMNAVPGIRLSQGLLPSPARTRPQSGILRKNKPAPKQEVEDSPRTFFPETWLWELHSIPASGVYEENLTLPDTVTEWVGKAVCVHPTEGVGLSSSSVKTFRDFFIDLTLPATAKRGEVIPVKISVFNYLNEPIPVHLTMMPSNEFEILSSGEMLDCIEAQDKVVHTIPIRPGVTGDLNITIDAYIDVNTLSECNKNLQLERRDTVIKPIHVDLEGFPKEKTFTDYLCVSDRNDAHVNWTIEVPPSIVEDSARGFVMAVGDLMGPTIGNLGHLVRMPSGCGEQNMIGFAPNIFVMQYLEASAQGNEEIKENAKKYMEAGYKRELNYRHKDGSYSAFGERDASGSTWLTAFVLKCFAQARPYIFIDQEELHLSTTWLKNLQGPNGCFSKEGKILHKGMKGGVGSSDSESVLTSFVLISLMEAGESPKDKFVSDAISCIASDPTSHPYALALKAYALTLAKDDSAMKAVEEMLSKVTEIDGDLRWSGAALTTALSLETSGYAILALMESGRIQDAVKFTRSINTKRNGQGGFISTQDTIVALQAMARFERDVQKGNTDLTVLLDMGGSESSININEMNKLLLQKATIPSFPTSVNVDVFGDGCALVQAVLRYNVPKPDASEAFTLAVKATTAPDKGCKSKEIEVCASYQLPDLKSNMAIIEVDVMTGYIPDKNDLKDSVKEFGVIKRYEVDGSKVMFYIDEFTDKDTCVGFKVLREFEVEDAKNGTVSVYDYYSPEYAISETYRFPPVSDCIDIDTLSTTTSPRPRPGLPLIRPNPPPIPDDIF